MTSSSGAVVRGVARALDTEDDFANLFRAEFPSIVRTASLILGDPDRGNDIAQEAFTRLFVSWKKVSKYDRPGAWLRRVTIRLAGKEARRSSLLGAALRKLPVQVPIAAPHSDLQSALQELSHAQRSAVILHYLNDLPVREVAEALGCAEATAKVHLHRARKRLAEILGEEESS